MPFTRQRHNGTKHQIDVAVIDVAVIDVAVNDTAANDVLSHDTQAVFETASFNLSHSSNLDQAAQPPFLSACATPYMSTHAAGKGAHSEREHALGRAVSFRNSLAFPLLAVCAGLSFCSSASARPSRGAAKPSGVWGWTSGSQTYLRARPGAQTPAIAKVPRHTKMFVWGKFDGWYRVETPDHKFGWVYNSYIKSPDENKIPELSHRKARLASDRTENQTMYGSPALLRRHLARYGARGAAQGLQKQGIRVAVLPSSKRRAALKSNALKSAARKTRLARATSGRNTVSRNTVSRSTSRNAGWHEISATSPRNREHFVRASAPDFNDVGNVRLLPSPSLHSRRDDRFPDETTSSPRTSEQTRKTVQAAQPIRSTQSQHKAQAARKAAQQRAAQQRVAQERAAQERAAQAGKAAQQSREAEKRRQIAQARKAEEAHRLAEAQKAGQRLAQQKQTEQRIAQQQKVAQQRAALQQADQQRLAQQRLAQQQRVAEQRVAEQRKTQQRLANRARRVEARRKLAEAHRAARVARYAREAQIRAQRRVLRQQRLAQQKAWKRNRLRRHAGTLAVAPPLVTPGLHPLTPDELLRARNDYLAAQKKNQPAVASQDGASNGDPSRAPAALTPSSFRAPEGPPPLVIVTKTSYKRAKSSSRSGANARTSRGGSPRDYMYGRGATANGAATNGTTTNGSLFGQTMARQAMSYRGMPYISGASSPNRGFDCSGLIYYLLRQRGYNPPRTAAGMASYGHAVKRGELQSGDLVLFSNTYKRGISHIGIYVGNGKFVHAANHSKGVTVDSLSSRYYASKYYGARRVK